MFKTNPRQPVQGTGAEPLFYALKAGFMILFLLVWAAFTCPAQTPDTLDIQNLSPQMEYTKAPLNAGDTLEIALHLGSPNDSVINAVGFLIQIELSNKAVQAVCEPFTSANSWLLDDGNHADTSYMDAAGTATLHLESIRTDTLKKSGFGEVLRFKVIADIAVDNPADLFNLSGGMVLVDNVEMKTAMPIVDCPEWQLAPNPAHQEVRVVSDELANCAVELLNMQGEKIQQVAMYGRELALDIVERLPEGMYIVRMNDKAGCLETKKLMVRH